jgi:uncharacterized protein (TIGR02594 family)
MRQIKDFKYKQLPIEWEWLLNEPGPKMLDEALQHYGILEKVGKGSQPDISQWAKELNLQNTFTDDDIPWCGLFVAIVAKRCGKTVVKNPLWAKNWLNFGIKALTPMLGDVMVFGRGSGGHVGFYVGETDAAYAILGGNQSNSVTITWISKNRFLGARRQYNIQPANVRVIKLKKSGQLSTNEA